MAARVLAFGDDDLLTEILRQSGLEVLRAPGRSRSLGLAKDLLPELVLVHAGADRDSAIELLSLLATDGVTRLLPAVLVLDRSDPAALRDGFEAGASEVVSLDMAPEELLARARAALRSKRLLEERTAEKQRLTLLELAGAVAHKMNQPLTSMSIIVETLLASHSRKDLSADRLQAKLLELQRLVDRMAAIVKQIAGVVEYRTVDYIGDVKIIDLEPGDDPPRRG